MPTKVVIFLSLILAALALNFRSHPFIAAEGETSSNQVQYFDQILDHYSYLPARFWKQRYFVDESFFSHHNGPVMLVLCGEGPCGGVRQGSWVSIMAEKTNALIIALEHRYYGDSLPFRQESFQTSNMKYLSSKQALRDIAFFIEQVKRNKWYNISDQNKWITVGGSYSGALSAWFRAKYPHLTVGAIASSGVILAVEDFRQFDEQIYISANRSGYDCTNGIKKVTDYAESKVLGSDRIAYQTRFKAEKLTSRQFMFYWSDAIVFQIQYGNRSQFCSSLHGKNLTQMLEVVEALVMKVSPKDYGAYYLADPQLALQTASGTRPWYYQCCTQFSYFQTYSTKHPMRSTMLTLDFYAKWCDDIYGGNSWPSVNRTNLQYGGLHLRATNLIMTNGAEDPWKWASLQNNYKDIIAKVANCTDCAHCKDLSTPNKKDPKELTSIRDLQLSLVKKWAGL